MPYQWEDRSEYVRSRYVSFLMCLLFLYISFLFTLTVAQICMMTDMVTCYTEWRMLTSDHYGKIRFFVYRRQSIITAYVSNIIIHLKTVS